MADGSLKPIDQVLAGDMVQGSLQSNKVEKVIVFADDNRWLYSLNGGKYFVTEVHPFMTKGGVWKAFDPVAARKENPQLVIEQLKVGDVLVTRSGSVELTNFDRIWQKQTVYNIVVTNSHDYYADGYLVHNKSSGCVSCVSPNTCNGCNCGPAF